MKTAYLATAAILCAAPSFAQTDDCAAPTAINTTGSFNYDTSANTASGVSPCGAAMNTDAFWVWTCPADGTYIFDTCGTSYDTRIGVYSGVDCAATCIAENDDTCGLQSQVSAPGLLAGDQLVVQVGGFGTTNVGPGVMNISVFVDPCAGQAPDAFEENDTCAGALVIGDGQYTGLNIAKSDWDYYRVSVADQATLTADIFFSHATADMDIFLYDALDVTCDANENVQTHGTAGSLVNGFSVSDNESIAWTNTTGVTADYIIEVNVWGASAGDCNDYDMVITGTTGGGGGPTITIACDPANDHTQGNYAKLDNSDASGPGVLHLECTDGPVGEFGYFLVSDTINDPGTPVSNGMLCVTGTIGRYAPAAGGALNSIGSFNSSGVLQNAAGTSTVGTGYDVLAALPDPPAGTIDAGETWYFQCWYRDGQRSNFSNVICVTF